MKLTNKKLLIFGFLVVIAVLSVYFIVKIYKNDVIINSPQNNIINNDTVFVANVGKFRLDLPGVYAVIKNVDGDTPTGARTVIEVGQQLAYLQNVVSSPNLGKASITATPLSGKSVDELLEMYVADDEIISTQQVDIDGRQATFLVLDSDVQKDLYYFDETDIFYVLYFENTNQSDELNDQKEAILRGFTLIE